MNQPQKRSSRLKPLRALATALAAIAAVSALQGCAPLVVGGVMVGSAMMAIDRRSSGAQVDDQAIELNAANRVGELATLGNVAVTSYNRLALITGQVPAQADRARVEEAVKRLANVRGVFNELTVGANSSMSTMSNDSYISGKVKASFVDAKDLQANVVKVVTERGVVYLMGIVTEREATRAAEIARSVPGVQKVVRVFEIVTEQELAAMLPKPTPAATAASAPAKP
jgi:osmotically-inducible protein OsmY